MHDALSDSGLVLSVILSKMENANFEEIAAVSSVIPHNVTIKNSLGASVTGQLKNNGQSNIVYKWLYPSNEAQGEYRCQVFSIDKIGHPVYISAEVEIAEKSIDLSAIVDKMKTMDIAIQGQKQQINDLSKQVIDLQTKLNSSLQMIFQDSSSFEGHRYFLSRKFRDIDVATMQINCMAYGGYLVEINNGTEFDFVKNFLNSFFNDAAGDWVIVGASDQFSEGKWVFMKSNSPISFPNWNPGEPSRGSDEDCMMLMIDTGRRMHDCHCHDNELIVRYMCEIPIIDTSV